MNPIAEELNNTLAAANPYALETLSRCGKELYFPSKGILAQSAEAKEKAKKFNATIGIASTGDAPLVLPSVAKYFSGLSAGEIFNYVPSFGLPGLRQAWKDRMFTMNPSLVGKAVSQPVVTCGITHGLSLCGDLLVGPGDTLLMPDQHWEYRLIFETRREANIQTFPFLSGSGMDLPALEKALDRYGQVGKKIVLLLNFPNNPTGYAPTTGEAEVIIKAIQQTAQRGVRLAVILDDAYTGLFYKDDVYPESLFGRLADLDEKVLAVKLDGATKELFVWGFRVGFLTWAGKGLTAPALTALEQKTGGAVRGTISNDNAAAQAILAKALKDPTTAEGYQTNYTVLKDRALAVMETLKNNDYSSVFTAYPFNAGYFMLLKLKSPLDAETMRKHLLEHHGVGVIATAPTDIRVAFSCVDKASIAELFSLIYQAGKTLLGN